MEECCITATANNDRFTLSSVSAYAGGIAGINGNVIKDCYCTGIVSAFANSESAFSSEPSQKVSASSFAGGIAGSNSGSISNCYNTCEVTANAISESASSTTSVGGITGYNSGSVSTSYNTGHITATKGWAFGDAYGNAGGIAGQNKSTIYDCYNLGTISAEAERGYTGSTPEAYFGKAYAGGIAGANDGRLQSCSIQNCYSIGNAAAANYNNTNTRCSIGGIVGYNSMAQIEYCYYLDITGLGGDDSLGLACSMEELKQVENFAGFDFDSIWTLLDGNTFPFPILRSVEHIAAPENTIDFSGGNGTAYKPYLISDKDELESVKKYPYAFYRLKADINLIYGSFENSFKGIQIFTGVFDGNGWSIKRLESTLFI